MSAKIRLLAISDWADTGFGRVFKELLPRLAKTGLFEIEVVAWCHNGDPDVYDEAKKQGVRIHMPHGKWGKETARAVANRWRPHVVLSLGDPWMIDWIQSLPTRETFAWVAYVPIDRDPISRSWCDILKNPDVLVLYSMWSKGVVEKAMPFRHPEFIPHGVDHEVFKPLGDSTREAVRRMMKVPEGGWMAGMVCRNQERKQVPRFIAGFKAFNCATRSDDAVRASTCEGERRWRCDGCPHFRQDEAKKKTVAYLHMTMGDGSDPDDGRGISWNIVELIDRYGLKGRIVVPPGLRVRKGIPSRELNQIYNALDLHVITSKREGFCLPVLEAMAAGVPNAVTDYSACAELVEAGGGAKVRVLTYVNEPHDEAEGAIVDVGALADVMDHFFADPDFGRRVGAGGRMFATELGWDSLVEPWVNVLSKAAGRPAVVPAAVPCIEKEVEAR